MVAATNKEMDSQAAITTGNFRQILSPAHIPNRLALRDRREDIPRLASYFLTKIGAKLKRPLHFDTKSMSRLMEYGWPGNVRELQNVIERAVILSQTSQISVDEILLPAHRPAPASLSNVRPGES
ncbi:MAG: hypothetical protein U0361_07250 [Nitrospiraceae bacterium]